MAIRKKHDERAIAVERKDIFCSNYNPEYVKKGIESLRNGYLMLGVLPNIIKIPVNSYNFSPRGNDKFLGSFAL